MAIFWGVALALGVAAFGAVAGFDRERSFYPLVLTVTATYYDLFAAMAGSTEAVIVEASGAAAFVAAAVAAYRWNLWIAAAGLALHAFLDQVHSGLIANPGVPAWWPAFCLSFDVAAAACLAWLILSGRQVAVADTPIPQRSR